MASVSNPGPEAVVTVKVTFEGTTRRAKMPLRDMVPRVLEENVRCSPCLLHALSFGTLEDLSV